MFRHDLEAVLLAQGNELLTGQTVDTNSNWMASRLWALGVPVRRVISAPDRLDDLVEILKQARALGPIVICTGGLGPTRDDLTAEAVAIAFDRPLAEDPVALAQIEAMFARRGRTLNPANRKQALMPRGARVLENRWGTAPAFALDLEGCTLYFAPGVPRELYPIFDTWIEPDLRERNVIEAPTLHTVRVMGVPESDLEMKLRGLEVEGLDIGFRTKMPENQVKLIFRQAVPEAVRQQAIAEVRRRIGPRAFGVDCGDLAEVTGQLLVAQGATLALAESCTAGGLAAWVASVPGASRYLLEGAVVYANEAKTRTCGVSAELLAEHGAVSEAVARQMAEGIAARAGATYGVGITGIAGPDGGSPEKPVGTVHVAVKGPRGTVHRSLLLPGDRDRVTRFAAASALYLLYAEVLAATDSQTPV